MLNLKDKNTQMAKVVIFSGSGQGNMGDDAILTSNLNILKQGNDYELLTFSPRPENAAKIQGVEAYPDLGRIFNQGRRVCNRSWRINELNFIVFVAEMLFNAKRLRLKKRLVFLSENERGFLCKIAESDAFLLAGGGTLNDHFDFKALLAEILIAKALGIKCFLGAQTIGPLNKKISRRLLRWALEDTVLTLRDKNLSKNVLLNDIKLRNDSIYECVDDAFLLPAITEEKAKDIFRGEGIEIGVIREHHRIIGINPRGWWKEAGQKTGLRKALLELLRYCVEKKYYVIFVPTAEGGGETSKDRNTALELLQEACLINHPNVRALKEVYGASEIKGLLGLLDCAIGISYHFNLFALTQGIPTIGIYQDEYYRLKLSGLHAMYAEGKFAVNVGETPFKELAYLVEQALSFDKKALREKTRELSGSCCSAAKQLNQFIENKNR